MYLDVGTNTGVQIRKLYEPKDYPNAKIHKVFDEYFQRKMDSLSDSLPYICAIGFEPNPNFEKFLEGLLLNYHNFKKDWYLESFGK